jgi:hypothetical protein
MNGDTAGATMRIGARNPFVYAEHVLKEKIKWNRLGPGQKRKKLEKAFGMPYNQLFDPLKGSPLFVKIVQANVNTGDLRPCITVSNPTWALNPAGSNYTVATRAHTDLVQGDLPDCFFIAALSSVAFSAPALIPDKPSTPYSYTFYNPPAVEGGTPVADKPISVSNLLPLDPAGKYHYSKSFTAGEIWPAMYEKAFASWKGSRTDKPDYSIICQGDPVLALMNLTGWRFTTYKPGTDPVTSTASRYSTQNFSDGTKIYNKINSVCQYTGPYRTTSKPMVAYTYDPRIERPPSGITYSDATIVGNHSYSVLGVHSVGAENYIVMRNPWGQKGAGPGSGDPDPSQLPAGAVAAGAWYQIANLADANDAIFALKASVFRDYFKGFGWVYQ